MSPIFRNLLAVFGTLVLLSIVIALLFPKTTEEFVAHHLEWKSDVASARYPDVLNEFGSPRWLVPTAGGAAEWTAPSQLKGTPLEVVQIFDEKIPHCCPSPHYDFLQACVCVDIKNPLQLTKVLGLTKSIWYDQLTQRLWARCHFMGAVVATLLLATTTLLASVATPSPTEAQYASAMKDSKDQETYQKMMAELSENVKKIGCTGAKSCQGKKDCTSMFKR